MTPSSVRWLAEYVEDGELFFRIGTTANAHVAEWVGLAVLTASRDGTGHSLTFADGVSAAERRKIERGSARLLLRHLEGKLALHGAAVERDGEALILLGRSGRGKSTLAAAACRSGFRLLADDAVMLDPRAEGGWSVLPSESDHWLDASAHQALATGTGSEGKSPISAFGVAPRASRLCAIVELVVAPASATVELEVASGLTALEAIVPQAVRFALDDDSRNRRELDALLALTASVPVVRLRRPFDFSLLPAGVRALGSLLSRSPDG